MKRLILIILTASALGAFASDLPKFDEVCKVLRENLPGVSENELDQAAVKGLIGQLQPRVLLADSVDSVPALAKFEIFDNTIACARVGRVGADLASQIATAYTNALATNKAKIKGIVLDLRFAGGTDNAAAAQTADLFINKDQPLLDWGGAPARSTAKTNAISIPLAILINAQTRGSAEALAAALRESGAGLVLGSPSAGAASVYKELPLSNNTQLRIATGVVKLGSGAELSHPLAPDIAVSVPLEDEKVYVTNSYAALHRAATATAGDADSANHTSRRYNEAELVRQQREGDSNNDIEAPVVRRADPPQVQVVADPVLSRGLDLVKGLAVVQLGDK